MNKRILCFPNHNTKNQPSPDASNEIKCKATNTGAEINTPRLHASHNLRRLCLWLPFRPLNDNLIALFLPSKSFDLNQLFPRPALLPSAPL